MQRPQAIAIIAGLVVQSPRGLVAMPARFDQPVRIHEMEWEAANLQLPVQWFHGNDKKALDGWENSQA
jgi:hypothetical protein